MNARTLYTAVGHFRCKHDLMGRSCPVVLINQQEYMLDLQEMTVWSILAWRLMDDAQLEKYYDSFAREMDIEENRTLEDCLKRLVVRGLVASGTGGTDFEAMYDLLGSLYVAPISESLALRLTVFFKAVFRGCSIRKACKLFERDRPNAQEAQVMALSRQALLSTAELIKCVELGVTDLSSDEKVIDALYGDSDTTSDNIRYQMQDAENRASVTMAVANLLLRRQIIFERV